MADTPSGVADGTLRDGAEASSRAAVEGFWTKSSILPPMLGPRSRGTRVAVYFSGSESFSVQFGDIGFSTDLWTDTEGLGLLIGKLQAAKVRAEIAREKAPLAPLDDSDIPF
jgi:hypothetical protein